MSHISWNAIVPPWLSDSLPQGLMVTDHTLTIRVWNRWLGLNSGLSAEQVLGQPLTRVFPELVVRGLDQYYHRVLDGEPITLQRRQLGYLLPLAPPSPRSSFPYMQQRARISPVELDGQIVGTITTVEDMTDPAEQDLRLTQTIIQQEESLALLDTLLTKAPIGFAFLDPTLRYRRINERLAEIHGLSAEEHLGRSIEEVVPDLAAQQIGLLRRVLETGEPLIDVEIVGETRAHPGALRSWMISYYPVQTAGRRRLGVGLLVTEVTQRRRQEQSAHFLSELTNTLSESLEPNVVLRRLSRKLLPFLADWCVIETVGEQPWEQHMVAAHCDPNKDGLVQGIPITFPPRLEQQPLMQAMFSSGRPIILSNIDQPLLRALIQGEQHLATVSKIGPRASILAPLMVGGRMIGMLWLSRTESEAGYTQADLAMAEEVANRIALALQNMRLFAAAQESQRVAEEAVNLRDAFFSIAAHELRTPLTTLLGRSQLLRKWLAGNSKVDERSTHAIHIVVEQAQRLNKMISALLDISRIQSGRFSIDPDRMDLSALICRVAEETRPTLNTHSLELQGCDKAVHMLGDEVRLEQVLQNLISNAVKYSPNGGSVLIELDCDDDYAILMVRDHGIGIPFKDRRQLFHRFYRAENAEAYGISGLGIGLFVVHEIVELHGGSIAVESELDSGSSFTVRLPRLSERVPA